MLTYVARTNQITALRYACSCQRVNQLFFLSLMIWDQGAAKYCNCESTQHSRPLELSSYLSSS